MFLFVCLLFGEVEVLKYELIYFTSIAQKDQPNF